MAKVEVYNNPVEGPFNFLNIGKYGEGREIAARLDEIDKLNFGEEGFWWGNILRDMSNPRGATILLSGEEGQVLGYTCAIPALEAYGTNPKEYGDRMKNTDINVAYIVNTSLHPHWQRQGLVWGMLAQLEVELRSKDYDFLDRDVTGEHYFEAVMNRYKDRIIGVSGPTKSVYGDQWYLRMRL